MPPLIPSCLLKAKVNPQTWSDHRNEETEYFFQIVTLRKLPPFVKSRNLIKHVCVFAMYMDFHPQDFV